MRETKEQILNAIAKTFAGTYVFEKALRRFELRLLDSESRVLTVTPQGHVTSDKIIHSHR